MKIPVTRLEPNSLSFTGIFGMVLNPVDSHEPANWKTLSVWKLIFIQAITELEPYLQGRIYNLGRNPLLRY